jgi:uncharacterized protein DUF3108
MICSRLALFLCLLLPAVAFPSSAPRARPIAALYDAFWAGLPAARIRLELDDGGRSYRDAVAIASAGLPRLVIHFRGRATAAGRAGPSHAAEPWHYDAVYDLRKRRDRRIAMRFVRDGPATLAERGPGDTSRKPPLAAAYRRDVVDPVSAVERIREALRRAQRGGADSFTVPVYDGARRFDLLGRVLPQNGGGLPVALSLRPIAGFKGSADGDPDDALRPARLVVSNDAALLPLSFEVPIWYLPLVVRLDRLCRDVRSCAL